MFLGKVLRHQCAVFGPLGIIVHTAGVDCVYRHHFSGQGTTGLTKYSAVLNVSTGMSFSTRSSDQCDFCDLPCLHDLAAKLLSLAFVRMVHMISAQCIYHAAALQLSVHTTCLQYQQWLERLLMCRTRSASSSRGGGAMQPQALRHHPRFQLLHRALPSAANFGPSSSLGLHRSSH